MNLLNDYINLVAKEKAIKAQVVELQKEIYIKFKKDVDTVETGVVNCPCEGFKVKITKKLTPSVDQELAATMNFGFGIKYSLDKKEYKDLSKEDQVKVDECITYKPAKPSFSIEREG